MYGSGVGDLVSEQNCYFPTYFGNFIYFYFLFTQNVYVRVSGDDRKVWGLSGDAGNNWYMAQAPISSVDPFRVTMKWNTTLELPL